MLSKDLKERWKIMRNELIKLIKVKSIVTIILTLVFCELALKGVVSGEQFVTIFTTVIAFYFGTQFQKNENKEE